MLCNDLITQMVLGPVYILIHIEWIPAIILKWLLYTKSILMVLGAVVFWVFDIGFASRQRSAKLASCLGVYKHILCEYEYCNIFTVYFARVHFIISLRSESRS